MRPTKNLDFLLSHRKGKTNIRIFQLSYLAVFKDIVSKFGMWTILHMLLEMHGQISSKLCSTTSKKPKTFLGETRPRELAQKSDHRGLSISFDLVCFNPDKGLCHCFRFVFSQVYCNFSVHNVNLGLSPWGWIWS